MKTLWLLAVKEVRDSLRNRWVAATILALAALALVLALLGAAPAGGVKASALSVTVVSLASLTVYLLPLIALMLAYDAVVGELERGTLALLLSYPLARWQIIMGKFLGHLAVLTLAILLGYAAAAALIAALGGADRAGLLALAALMGSSVLLGAAFLALGYVISALVDERSKAAGLAVALWLGLVVIYDLALLGMLLLDGTQSLGGGVFTGLVLANPTDAFRVFNMTLIEGARDIGGFAALEAAPPAGLPLAVLGGWALAALALATRLLQRREI